MRYTQGILEDGETLQYVGTLTPAIYLPGFLITLFSVAGAVVAQQQPLLKDVADIAVIAAVLGVLLLAWQILRQWTTEIALTDRRLIFKTGLIARTARMLSVPKLTGATVHQSVSGRLLRYGSVEVEDVGNSAILINQVGDPRGFGRAIERVMAAARTDPTARNV